MTDAEDTRTLDDLTSIESDISLGEFETSLGLLVRVAQLTAHELLYSRLQHSNNKLTVGEFTILQAIGENPGIRQGILADRLHIKWPSMTKLVNDLEKRGYLRRVVPFGDRRSFGLVLTEEGKMQVAEQKPKMMIANTEVFSMLEDAEQQILVRLLRKVVGWETL
jgi:DNA-binding MarR family transcriptional regulator